MCFKPRKPNDEMIIKNSNKQSELYFSMYLTVVKLILNITFFVAFSLLLYVSKSISFYFLLNVVSGHTFALGTETFIPRSQWDVKHLVRNIPSPASLCMF